MLKPMSVAEFYEDVMIALRELGIEASISTMPCEINDCIPFEQDTVHTAYDADYANRFWRVLLATQEIFAHFRTGFLGKTSPVHFFWGSFDLAVTRFSGRPAPRHPGGVPSSVGCRRAGGVFARGFERRILAGRRWACRLRGVLFLRVSQHPIGFGAASVKPQDAFFSKDLGEFLMPYDAVRTARDPDAALMEFLQSTYDAAASLAKWDRKSLECGLGEVGKPRPV